jgi:thioredoxin-dependent peroxiredoxin
MAKFVVKNLIGGARMLKVGDPAPDFEATSHDGKTVRLSDYRGKKVVLWFYPKADTPG